MATVVTLEPKSSAGVKDVMRYGRKWIIVDSRVNPFKVDGVVNREMYLRPLLNFKVGGRWVRTLSDPNFEWEVT